MDGKCEQYDDYLMKKEFNQHKELMNLQDA